MRRRNKRDDVWSVPHMKHKVSISPEEAITPDTLYHIRYLKHGERGRDRLTTGPFPIMITMIFL